MPEKSNPTAAWAAFDLPREVAAAGHGPFDRLRAGPGHGLSQRDDASGGSHEGDASRWLESGLAVLDADGTILQLNDELCAWLEVPVGQCLGKCFWARFRERCGESAASLGALLQSPEAFDECHLGRELKLEIARHSERSFVRLASVRPRWAELEEDVGRHCSDSKPMQRQLVVRLAQAEGQLKLLMAQWPGVIFSQRVGFSFRFVSPGIEALRGVTALEWQRKPQWFWQTVHEADAKALRDHLATARNPGETLALTYRLRHLKTGRIAHVLEHRRSSVTAGGLVLGYEGVWLDVTRQTLAEQRLSSAAWKEALSVLTMGL